MEQHRQGEGDAAHSASSSSSARATNAAPAQRGEQPGETGPDQHFTADVAWPALKREPQRLCRPRRMQPEHRIQRNQPHATIAVGQRIGDKTADKR